MQLFRSRGASLGLTAVVAAALVTPTAALAATQVTVVNPALTRVNLLNINDFHGYFSNQFACTVVQQRTALGADSTLFLSAGDNVGGSDFASAIQNDQPTIDFLNALGLQASAVGNHEFDQGFADLSDRIIPAADWDYLGANVYDVGTTTVAAPLKPYSLHTINGLTVAVVGAVTTETPNKVSPSGVAMLTFGDPVAAVNREAALLKDGVDDPANGNAEADIVVAQYHEGSPLTNAPLATATSGSSVFASIVNETSSDVDVIFNGDKHALYAYAGPVPGQAGETRPIVQSKQYGEYLGSVQLGYDATTERVTEFVMTNVARPKVTDPVNPACLSDPTYQAAATVVSDAKAYSDLVGQQQVGTVTADITTANKNSDGTFGRDNRTLESSLANMIAQSYVDSLAPVLTAQNRPLADIGVVNPGAVRAELFNDANGITYAEAASIMPFGNLVKTITVKGSDFVTVLEQQWPHDNRAGYLQLGLSEGVTYTYDPAAPYGQHITSVTIDGEPIDLNATYVVASNSFLLEGGDNFTAFTQGTSLFDSGLVDQGLFVQWIKDHSPLTPSFAKHAVAVVGKPSRVYAGETATFSLRGTKLTSLGAPSNTSVTVTLDGEVPSAQVPVAPTAFATVPAMSEEALVRYPVPAELPAGDHMLRATFAPSGTVVTFPVRVVAATAVDVSGTPRVGGLLSATVTTDQMHKPSLAYQWQRQVTRRDGTVEWVNILGATGLSYAPRFYDAGTALRIQVTSTYADSTVTRVYDQVSVPLQSLYAPFPTLTGAPAVGKTLTCSPGVWGPAPVNLTYAWKKYPATGGAGTTVFRATWSAYQVRPSDVGYTLACVVTGSKPYHQTVSKTSYRTAIVR